MAIGSPPNPFPILNRFAPGQRPGMGPSLPANPQYSLPSMGDIPMDPDMIPPQPEQQVPPGAGEAITALTNPRLQETPIQQASRAMKELKKIRDGIMDGGIVQILKAITRYEYPNPSKSNRS